MWTTKIFSTFRLILHASLSQWHVQIVLISESIKAWNTLWQACVRSLFSFLTVRVLTWRLDGARIIENHHSHEHSSETSSSPHSSPDVFILLAFFAPRGFRFSAVEGRFSRFVFPAIRAPPAYIIATCCSSARAMWSRAQLYTNNRTFPGNFLFFVMVYSTRKHFRYMLPRQS